MIAYHDCERSMFALTIFNFHVGEVEMEDDRPACVTVSLGDGEFRLEFRNPAHIRDLRDALLRAEVRLEQARQDHKSAQRKGEM